MNVSPALLRVGLLWAAALGARAAHPFLCTDSAGGKVAVVSADGAVEWELACKHPQDCWVLPNGNFLFCHATGAIEMTREKKVVWQFADHTHFKTINQIQVLDVKGDVTKGEILR